MEISFASRKLKQLCESEKELRKAYGSDGAKKAMRRLSDLRAAATLEDMRNLPGRIHELTGDRNGQLAIDLARWLAAHPGADQRLADREGRRCPRLGRGRRRDGARDHRLPLMLNGKEDEERWL